MILTVNPVHEWLRRVARECGSPVGMVKAAEEVANQNSRRLVRAYAAVWQKTCKTRERIAMSERTLADIEADIQGAVNAREARASLSSDDGKWDESRAIFIENCNNRIANLVKERDALRGRQGLP